MSVKLDNEYNNFLRSQSVEDIERMYKAGDISAQVYVNRTRNKARLELSELEQGTGFVRAVLIQSKKNFMEGWDAVVDESSKMAKEEADKALENPSLGNLVSVAGAMQFERLKAMWGTAQMLFAVMGSGLGDVVGMRIENNALRQGYSAGAARVLGFAADIASGAALPVSGIAKGVAKAGEVLAPSKIAAMASEEVRWMRAIAEGLALDGVADAGKVITNVAKQAGKTELAQTIEKIVSMADDTLRATKIPSTVQSSFIGEARDFTNNISKEAARAELPGLMKKFGISWPDLKTLKQLKPGKNYGPEEFYGYLKALEARVEALGPLARRAIAKDATLGEQQAFARAATELMTGPKDKLDYSKEFIDLLTHWDPMNVAKGDINAAMRSFATDLAQVSPKKLGQFSLKSQDGFIRYGQVMPAIKEMFVNMLLPLASVPAFVGNSVGAANTIVERLASGHPMEAAYMMKGMAWATADALKAFGMAFTTSGGRGTIPGAFGRVVRLPSDSMMAMDAAFKVIVARGSLYGDALAAGLRGQQLRRFVQNPPPQALEDAFERAYRATYQNDLGQFAARWSEMARSGPGTFYFTFIKSPLNLVKYGWDRTPGLQFMSGRLWHDFRQGGTMASDAAARLTMAQLQAMMVWELAKEGFITGGGPADPALRKAWLLTHQPYSLKTSAGWVPLGGLDPVTMPISLVADVAQLADQLDPDSMGQLAMASTFAFMRNVANRTSWRTFSDLIDVVQGAADAKKWTKRDTAAMMAPVLSAATGGSLVSRTASITDPVQRDARNLYDQFRKRVPGYADDVPPLRDGLGDPVIPPTTIGSPWFGYFSPAVPKLKPLEGDPIKKEAARVQATLPTFPDHIGAPPRDDLDISQPLPGDTKVGVAITPQQRDRLQQLYRNVIRHPEEGLEAFINSEEYKSWPLARQRAEFNSFVSQAKALAREHLLIEDVELAKKVATNDFQKALPLEQPEDRPAMQQEHEQEIRMLDQMNEEEKENIAKWGFLEKDQPYTQQPVEILGVEILGQRQYEPKVTK